MKYLTELFKNFLGPALFAGVLILGWWAYNDISVKKANIEFLGDSVQQLTETLGGQCKTLLERQGFTVGVEVEEAKPEE